MKSHVVILPKVGNAAFGRRGELVALGFALVVTLGLAGLTGCAHHATHAKGGPSSARAHHAAPAKTRAPRSARPAHATRARPKTTASAASAAPRRAPASSASPPTAAVWAGELDDG